MIATGKDGLKAVAETRGAWNWVLLGPSPEELPLVGGGRGGVDEMRDCIRKTKEECGAPILYGVLRLEFGAGKTAMRKFIFVRASVLDDDWKSKLGKSQYTTNSYGQDAAQCGEMERAVNRFLHTVCMVQVSSTDDLTLDLALSKLNKIEGEQNLITEDAHSEAMAVVSKNSTPSVSKEFTIAEEVIASQWAPKPDVFEAQEEGTESDEIAAEPALNEAQELYPLRAPVQAVAVEETADSDLYPPGTLVVVYSESKQQWLDDGVVVKKLYADGVNDGIECTKNSIKVCYNSHKTFKWLSPGRFETLIKPSGRPRQPKSLSGQLFKQTHVLFTIWTVHYFDLSKGYLQWWPSEADARDGRKPSTSLYLAGMELTLEGTLIKLRTPQTKGRVYTFDATTTDGAKSWKVNLEEHEAFCNGLQKYFAEKSENTEEGQSEKYTDAIKNLATSC